MNKQYIKNFKKGVVGRLTTGVSHFTLVDNRLQEEPCSTYQELYDLNIKYGTKDIRRLTWMYRQYKGLYFDLKNKPIELSYKVIWIDHTPDWLIFYSVAVTGAFIVSLFV